MTSSIIRSKLHSFIENAGESELKRIYSFVEDELAESSISFWEDEKFVKELEKRSNEKQVRLKELPGGK